MRTSTPKATHISLLRSGKCGHLRPKLPIFHSYGAENADIYAQSYPYYASNGAENAVIYALSLNANGLNLAQTKMVVQH